MYRVLLSLRGISLFSFVGRHVRQWTTPRQRIRELTRRARLCAPVEKIIQDVNRFLRGWAGYFRYGNSARFFTKIQSYALSRLASVYR